MIRSIFGRLLLSHIGIILLTTVLLGVLMSFLLRAHVVETKRHDLLNQGYAMAALVAPIVNTGRLPYRLELFDDLVGADIWVVDQQGKLLAGNPPPRWDRSFPENPAQIEALFSGTPQTWVRNTREQPDPSIIVAVPLPANAPTPAAVFLYTPLTGTNLAVQALDRIILISLFVGTMAAIILGFFISRGLTRPLADISKAAARFAAGDLSSRSSAQGRDEVGSLARVFNDMASALAQTEQNRRDFLANVSHELKTPVASIQALAEALQDDIVPEPEKRQRYLATIVSESGRIDRLIHDLLDLAQLEAGELTVVREQLELQSFLAEEGTKYEQLLSAKRLRLNVVIQPPGLSVTADPLRLAQVMVNLISNAVRYAPEDSSIEISAKPSDRKVLITVTDQGPGVPPEDQPLIWDRFYRVDKSRARAGGGTGLGLAITKLLVQAMDGQVGLTSIPGRGAAFYFTLPAE